MTFASGWANNCGTELFTIGWVPCETPTVPVTNPTDVGRGSGPTDGIRRLPGYNKHHQDNILETRRKRILQEDEDIIALIMAMLTRGIM